MRNNRRRPTPRREPDIKVCWTNVGKSGPAHTAALKIAFREGIDVICMQEPATWPGTRTSNHPGYNLHPPVDGWDSRETWEADRPRVLIFTRKGNRLKITPRTPLYDQDMQ
jgi:hypothetical protein